MSDKVYEQLKTIHARKSAFYANLKHDFKRTPQVPVIRPYATSKYTKGSVHLIDVSEEYILGYKRNGK